MHVLTETQKSQLRTLIVNCGEHLTHYVISEVERLILEARLSGATFVKNRSVSKTAEDSKLIYDFILALERALAEKRKK